MHFALLNQTDSGSRQLNKTHFQEVFLADNRNTHLTHFSKIYKGIPPHHHAGVAFTQYPNTKNL